MISSTVAESIKIILNLRQFCLTQILFAVNNSLILPCLQYCPIMRDSTYSIHIPPRLGLQKKAVKIITKSPPCAHPTCSLRLYTFLIYSKFININSLALYLFTQQNFSPSLSPFFSIFISDFHKYSTRQIAYSAGGFGGLSSE